MDARFTNLDEEDGTPFLRKQKRVPVRRGPLPKKTTNVLKWVALAAVLLTVLGVAYAGVCRYGERSWRFRVDSSDQIEIAGAENVTRAQVMEVMGSDIGRNIFFVPLEERRAQLEQIPWVESASVMRFAPNLLKVDLRERTPVAFVRVGSHVALIDDTGHIMEIPAHKSARSSAQSKDQYSFPVISGTRDSEPLSTRAARMKTYNQLVRELDSEGGHYSSELSEVDLSDPEDAKVLVNDPSGDVLLHLGSSSSGSGNYLDRFKLYHAHVAEWRQQFEKLDSVDLRYERQIVVNPDLRSGENRSGSNRSEENRLVEKPSQPSPTLAKAAMAGGVPAVALAAAAIVKREQAAAKPPAAKLAAAKPVTAKSVTAKTVTAKSVLPKKTPVLAAAKTPLKASAASAKQTAAPKEVKPQNKNKVLAKNKAHATRKSAHKAVHKTAKKPATHKVKQAASKKRSASAAKAVKPASSKTTASSALAPARPHQVLTGKPIPSSAGKPHAAIVNQ